MKKNPLVSVIIPVFNGASYLVEAVESVQKSTFKDFEIMLIDDGSTDNSKRVCRLLEKAYPNVRFYSFTQNKGLGRVLNFALEKAHGTYICRINQDDRMLPHRMDRQVAYLQKNSKVVAVGSHITHFFDDGSKEVVKFLKTDREIREIWHIVGPFADPSVMYRRETALAVGGYDQTFWPVDDTHMWYRMGTKGKLANIPETLVDVRWHAKAGSVYHFRKMAWQIYRVRRWAHVHIQPGTIWHQMFWVAQLTAGMVLSPTMNWKIYRKIKKLIAWYEEKKYHAKKHVSGISNLRLYFN